jgi:hypothetical protein
LNRTPPSKDLALPATAPRLNKELVCVGTATSGCPSSAARSKLKGKKSAVEYALFVIPTKGRNLLSYAARVNVAEAETV